MNSGVFMILLFASLAVFGLLVGGIGCWFAFDAHSRLDCLHQDLESLGLTPTVRETGASTEKTKRTIHDE
jgi:hypothetical protein